MSIYKERCNDPIQRDIWFNKSGLVEVRSLRYNSKFEDIDGRLHRKGHIVKGGMNGLVEIIPLDPNTERTVMIPNALVRPIIEE